MTRGADRDEPVARHAGIFAIGTRSRQLRDRADDVIETGRARRLADEGVGGVSWSNHRPGVGVARKRRSPSDGRGDRCVGVTVGEVGADAFGLCPQPRHRDRGCCRR